MRARPLIVAGALAAGLAAPSAAQAAQCADADVSGGEWRRFGHDYSNTRHQANEKVISPGDAPTLTAAWAFNTKRAEAEGDFAGTPIVADGCVYVASSRGWVFSLNADTGQVVWKGKVPYGGGMNNTVGLGQRRCGTVKKKVRVRRKGAARRGKGRKRKFRVVTRRRAKYCRTVFVAVQRTRKAEGCLPGDECVGPYAAAFGKKTGKLIWATRALDTQDGADLYGSPVPFGRTVMFGISGGAAELGDESDRIAFQGSMVFLNANNGNVLRKTWTIHPPNEPEDEYAGATIWSTPAIDTEKKVAYAGTGNPFKPQAEHPNSNAVVKFDVDRKSPRFGEIIGAYKGDVDEYFPALSQLPCYDIPGNPPPYYPQGVGSCGDLDMDFGASSNLITDPDGRKLVGTGQKSGVYHIFDAETMEPVRKQIVGPPTAVGGIVGSTAYDGQSIYGPITVPGYVWSINAENASWRWAGLVADGAHWGPPVAVANGVVYTVDLTGFLNAYDARNGALLAKRPLAVGGAGPRTLSWGGVSVARNTIYASVGIGSLDEGQIIAFRPGDAGDTAGDLEQTLGGGGGGGGGGGSAPVGSAIVAGPGAVYTTYATPVMTVSKGGTLNFVNLDPPQHDVTAEEAGPDGRPVFSSRLAGIGEVVPVEGLDRVESGKQYGFFCSIHPGMRGRLIVR
jgi:outer membrane protein assembly factor BamB/plastocyanin